MVFWSGARLWWRAAAVGFAVLGLGAGRAAAVELDAAEQRGRQIYLTGTSASGTPITARIGEGAITMPASAVPCASCHGRDGRGRPESGVSPSDIRWSRLARGYGGVSASGRRHPAYDARTLARAIATGVDPGGTSISPAMPRFEMSAGDLEDLAAYLQRLEEDRDPGIDHDSVRVATVVPRAGPLAPVARGFLAVMQAALADINAAGGIYNRRIELQVAEAGTPQEALEQIEALAGSGIFALLGPFTEGIDAQVPALLEAHRVPLIAPVTAHPPETAGAQRFAFYLLPGPAVQARALVDFAAGKITDPARPLAIVHPPGGGDSALVEALARQAEKWGRPGPRREAQAEGAQAREQVTALRDTGTAAVFFTGDGAALERFLAAADAVQWRPLVLALGARAARAVGRAPEAFAGRLYLAFPSAPADITQAGWGEFSALRARHGLAEDGSWPAQIAGYVTVGLLAEALKLAGRELSRERLITALEGMHRYESGLIPRLSYNANRRVGAVGAHVVLADLDRGRLGAESVWVEPK